MKPRVTIEVKDRIVVRSPFALRDALKAIGGWWDPGLGCWTFTPTPEAALRLARTVANARRSPAFDELVRQAADHEAQEYLNGQGEPGEIPGLDGSSWRHQRHAYWFAVDHPNTMLYMGMGTGKSRVAVGMAVRPEAKRVLIICPRSVIPVWPREFTKHAPGRADVVALENGSSTDRTRKASMAVTRARGRVVVVVNYDLARAEVFKKWAMREQWDLVIADESHRIKSPSGITSRTVAAIGSRAPRRLALTGTPMPHGPLDVWAQYRYLDATVFGTSYVYFRNRHTIQGPLGTWDTLGYRDADLLNRKFYSLAFRAPDSVLDLPEAQTLPQHFDLSPSGREAYNDLRDQLMAELEDGTITAANAMVRTLRLQQLTGGWLPLDEGGTSRVDEGKQALLAETLEDIGEEPVVVFCRFHNDLDAVRAVAEKAGRTYYEQSGRTREWEAFQFEDGGPAVMGAQIQSGGLGIDLTRARYTIYYSVGYSLGDYEQSLKRTHRPGQERPVFYLPLVARGTVDEDVLWALQAKRDIVDAVLSRTLRAKEVASA